MFKIHAVASLHCFNLVICRKEFFAFFFVSKIILLCSASLLSSFFYEISVSFIVIIYSHFMLLKGERETFSFWKLMLVKGDGWKRKMDRNILKKGSLDGSTSNSHIISSWLKYINHACFETNLSLQHSSSQELKKKGRENKKKSFQKQFSVCKFNVTLKVN